MRSAPRSKRNARAAGPNGQVPNRRSRSEKRQVPLQLIRRHVGLEAVPLLTLAADQEFEDVIAERPANAVRMRGNVDGFVEVLGQRLDPGGAAILPAHLIDVVGGLG